MFRHFLDVLVVPLLQPAAAATITICCPIDLCKCRSILSTMTLFFDWTNNYDWLLQHALGRKCPLHHWPENNISCNDWAEIMIDYREQKHKHYHSFYYYVVCHFRSIERQRETKWKYVTGQPKNSSQNVCYIKKSFVVLVLKTPPAVKNAALSRFYKNKRFITYCDASHGLLFLFIFSQRYLIPSPFIERCYH